MVRISVGSSTHQVSERLYGVFFEDINHSADGGLNANMVNNYSFDGVYLDHHTWRAAGSDRWRTQADPLRFWDFTNCSAVSYGTEIRGAHGQRMTTDCPEPPVHANSRYVRITAPRVSSGSIIVTTEGWYRFVTKVSGKTTDYGKLRITVESSSNTDDHTVVIVRDED
ncbi:hypothetical protein B31L_1274 [Bifidobacterium breve 31L]|nr:hypothetical protein B31L_1274 [Bifidobacterium breve 31L]